MSMEKAVLGATKKKEMGPKPKYIDALVNGTFADSYTINDILSALSRRLQDDTWSVSFKALITIHYLIRDGAPERVLAALAKKPRLLDIASFSRGGQDPNTKVYHRYLEKKVSGFKTLKVDYIRQKPATKDGLSRLGRLSVEKGLLRETSVLQKQLDALLECKFHEYISNDVTLTAFQLLVRDLMDLFKVVTEAVMNILQQFLTLSKPDAETALDIYRHYATEDKEVEKYLERAKRYTYATRVNVEPRKSAPLSMLGKLQDWVNDPAFEQNRRDMIDAKEGKVTKKADPPKAASTSQSSTVAATASTNGTTSTTQQVPAQPNKAMDFFASIESELVNSGANPAVTAQMYNPFQQQMQMQMQPQMTSQLQPQMTGYNPFMQMQNTGMPSQMQNTGMPMRMQSSGMPTQMQPQFTGAQSMQQQQLQLQSQLQPQMTGYNPFASSSGPTMQPSMPAFSQQQSFNNLGSNGNTFGTGTGTNPFSSNTLSSRPSNPFSSIQTGSSLSSQPLLPMQTGTNPFSNNTMSQQNNPLSSSMTGMTSFSSTTSSSLPMNSSLSSSSTNPFSMSTSMGTPGSTNFMQSLMNSSMQPQPAVSSTMTGTNPFSTQQNGGMQNGTNMSFGQNYQAQPNQPNAYQQFARQM